LEDVSGTYELLRDRFLELMNSLRLGGESVDCEVFGADWARLPSIEYVLMRGKEVILHCEIGSWYGQAFTDAPRPFAGTVADVAALPLDGSDNRAVFFAVLNALMHASGRIDRTIHCRGNDAERCGEKLADEIMKRFGRVKVLHIGFQPGHVRALAHTFPDLLVTDLNPENVGKVRCGVRILDGLSNEKYIEEADVVYVTGSAIVNGTLFPIIEHCNELGRQCVVYGTTVIGAAEILGYELFCPYRMEDKSGWSG